MSVSCRKSLALLLTFFSGLAAARDLPRIDAFSKAPTRSPREISREESSIVLGGRRIQYEERLGVPTFLWTAPSTAAEKAERAARTPTAVDEARRTASKYASLYGLEAADMSAAKVTFVHDIGKGGILVKLHEEVGGVEVFREELTVLMDRSFEPVAISGYLSGAGRQIGSGLKFPLDERTIAAIVLADRTGETVSAGDLVTLGKKQGPYGYVDLGDRAKQHQSPSSLLLEPMRYKPVYFHTVEGFEAAYYVEVQAQLTSDESATDDALYGYVVSANDGRILFRNSMTDDAATSYSYRVWAETTGLKQPFEGPQGHALPHPTGNNDGFVAPFIAPSLITLPYGPIATQDPWLGPSAVDTNGNNVDAFVNLFSPDGFTAGDFRAPLSSAFAFDWTYDTTLAPQSTNQRNAAITQLFYDNNWLHDWFYGAGFDEVGRNAQKSNYGRGGVENDDIFAEAQDFSGTNNANMSTPADGGRPRMRMYVFSGPTSRFITVNTQPASGLLGTYPASRTNVSTTFGPQSFDVTADVVRATPFDGCSGDATWGMTAANGALLSGKIAFIDRGGSGGNCGGGFAQKVANAAHYGALGVIIANVATSSNPTLAPGMGGATALPTVGVLSLNLADGDAFRTALGLGTVNVRLFRFTGVGRDGDLDNQIVEHEWGHYLSNRLVGNGSGLGTTQSRGMGEGWSDFVAQLLTVRATDTGVAANATWNGVYTTGAYAAIALSSNSSYFGIRRLPYSTDMTKNPLTFKHIGNGNAISPPFAGPCDFGCDGSNNAEVHNTGEVWATMLWEGFAGLLRDTQGATPRLTFDQARDRMRNYLVASLKLTPVNPTVLEARDAVIAAAFANDPVDAQLFCQAYAKRGAGVRAAAPDRFSTTNTPVTEDFTCSNNLSFVSATLTPFVNCDGDGYLDNFETWNLAVTLRNTGGGAMSATTATVTSTNPALSFANGGLMSFPASTPGSTTTSSIQVSMNGAVGIQNTSFDVAYTDASITAVPAVLSRNVPFRGNADDVPNSSASDDVEPIQTAWTRTAAVGSGLFTRVALTPTNNIWNGPDPDETADLALVSPTLNVAATGNFSFTYDHRFSFEFSGSNYFDGGIVEISTDGGTSWTKIPDANIYPDYNHTLVATGTNPLRGTTAYSGQSPVYPLWGIGSVDLGTAYQGMAVKIRFRIGADANTSAAGWDIENLVFSNITNTPFTTLAPQAFPPVPPAATPIVGSASVIAGDADNDLDGQPGYTYSVPAVNGAEYVWSVPAGVTILSGLKTSSIKVSFDASPGPFPISVVVGNSCGSTSVSKSVTKASTSFSWDFIGTGPAPGWTPFIGQWGQVGDGTYGDVVSSAAVRSNESASYTTSYGNFVYEAQVVATRPGEPTAANTLWVRGAPSGSGFAQTTWNSGYAFNLSMSGKFSIFRVTNGRPAAVQAWVAPVDTTINGSGQPNTLKVIADGGFLTFFINGVPVKSLSGEVLLSGRVGLGMVRSNGSYVNDKLRAQYAFVTAGAPPAPPAVSAAQEAANQAANQAHPRPNPYFEGDLP